MNRVVITGMGVISPVGNTVSEFWDSIKNGKTGIDFITKINSENLKAKLAAEVKNFDAEKYMTFKEKKRMDLFSQYAVASAKQAIEDSGLAHEDLKGNNRVGIIFGSGIGGLPVIEEQIIKMHDRGPNRVSPLFVPLSIVNMAAGNIAIQFGINGLCSSVVTACASANHSIGEAFRNIKHGYSDIIIAGGSEATICEIGIAGFSALTALSTSEDKDRASIPFDKERNGFVMGEGAGSLILESYEHAKKRGAKIYAEVVGYGATCDAYHITSPDPEGTYASEAMKLAIDEANILIEDVGYINAHGTSTSYNDSGETKAIKKVFGSKAYDILISSTKSMTGHLLGAAAAIEAIACVKSLTDSFVPPTANLEVSDPDCDLNYVPNVGVGKDIKYALSNSFGFGGHNAVICFKKWEE